MSYDVRPAVPDGLTEDLKKVDVTIRYLDGDTVKTARGINDPFGSLNGFGGVGLMLRPFLVVTAEVADDPTDPGDGTHAEVLATVPLEAVLEIDVVDEPDYGVRQPISHWLRDPAGKLRRFPSQ